MPAKLPTRQKIVEQLREAGVQFKETAKKSELAPLWRETFDPDGTPPKRSERQAAARNTIQQIETMSAQAKQLVDEVISPETDELRQDAYEAISSLQSDALEALQDDDTDPSEIFHEVDESFGNFHEILERADDQQGEEADTSIRKAIGELESAAASVSLVGLATGDDTASDTSGEIVSSDDDEERIGSLLQQFEDAASPQTFGDISAVADVSQPPSEADSDEEIGAPVDEKEQVGRFIGEAFDEMLQIAEQSEQSDALTEVINTLGESSGDALDAGTDANDLLVVIELAAKQFSEDLSTRGFLGARQAILDATDIVSKMYSDGEAEPIADVSELLEGTRFEQQSVFPSPAQSASARTPAAPSTATRQAAEQLLEKISDASDIVRRELLTPDHTPAREPSLTAPGASSITTSPQERVAEASEREALERSIASVAQAIAADPDAVRESPGELAKRMKQEIRDKQLLESVKKLTTPSQVESFARNTRQTPLLRQLVQQGLYAPNSFVGPTGAESAAKIENQLRYIESSKQRTGTRRAADPIVAREKPTRNNPEIRRWRRPRFTTTTVR